MSCEACEKSTGLNSEEEGVIDRVYPFRIGNNEIGWGTIVVLGCKNHVKLTFDRLNSIERGEVEHG